MSRIKNSQAPDLRFAAGDVAGWTPVGLSGYRAMKPTAAVRELVQNSLDAAATRDGSEPLRMRFRIEQCRMSDIPGMDAYRKAFKEAKEAQEKLLKNQVADNAQAVAEDIQKCLGQPNCEVLHVLDNGIGLSVESMGAVLGDGISVKNNPNASGSYGNGHIVAFPASDLRYVLYGGVFAAEESRRPPYKKICAGHAILASRNRQNGEGGGVLSKDGYFVNEIRDDLFERYIYPEDGSVPPFIRRQLNWIESEWGATGSVVSITGFNRFREYEDVRQVIFQAAARSFFEAIHRGQLVLEYEQDNTVSALGDDSLEQALKDNNEQKRSSDSFLSGKRAYEAFLALKDGKKHNIPTRLGEVEVVIKHPLPSGGRTRVDLCRNGMWITDQMPKFQHHFNEREPFHCLVLLRGESELNRLFRRAEGPLHNGLELSLLNDDIDKKRELEKILTEIRDRLKELIPARSNESFRPDDIFLVNVKGLSKGKGGERAGLKGAVSRVKRARVQKNRGGEEEENGSHTSDDPKSKKRRKNTKPFRRDGNPMQLRGLVVPKGARACKASIAPKEKIQAGELRFVLDESIDITSSGTTADEYVIIKPDGLKLNGESVAKRNLRKNKDGKVLGIALEELDPAQTYEIEFAYDVPGHLGVPDDQPVVLKAEIIRRAPAEEKQDNKT